MGVTPAWVLGCLKGLRGWTQTAFFCLAAMLTTVIIFAFVLPAVFGRYGRDDRDGAVWKSRRPVHAKDNFVEFTSSRSDDSPDDDPTLDAELFEGDIADVVSTDLEGRNAVTESKQLWPNGRVPYVISGGFDKKQRQTIKDAMEHIHESTCIKLIPRDQEEDYIEYVPGKGCSSNVGRQGGKQDVTLGAGCLHRGIVVHETTHALGLWHEQSRPDRDDYVTIEWDNIKQGMAHNFKKYDRGEVTTLDLDYDMDSIMHYGPRSFALKSGSSTIRPRQSGAGKRMGQREAYTPLDAAKINKLYGCPAPKRSL